VKTHTPIKKILFVFGFCFACFCIPALSAYQEKNTSSDADQVAATGNQDEPLTAKEAGPEAGRKPPFNLTDKHHIDAGKVLYMRTCAGYCHGGTGEGGRAPSFRKRDDLDPAYAYKTIVNGRVASDVMPVFGHTFTSEQVWELVSYLLYLGAQKE
jgi:mono/diheme cytochrome c family protein